MSDQGSDVVTITGLRAIGRHGWFDYEQAEGQEFVVDVGLSFDTWRRPRHPTTWPTPSTTARSEPPW